MHDVTRLARDRHRRMCSYRERRNMYEGLRLLQEGYGMPYLTVLSWYGGWWSCWVSCRIPLPYLVSRVP